MLIDINGNILWSEFVDSSIGYEHFSVLYLPENSLVAYCYKGDYHTNVYKFDIDYNIEWQSELNGNVAHGDRCIKLLDDGGFICGLRNVISSPNIGLAKLDSNGQVVSVNNEILYTLDYKLSNYPNPFNPTTTIIYKLPRNIKNPVLEITNVKGQLVYKLSIANHQSSIVWNGKSRSKNTVSSGVYFFRIKSDNFISKTSRMILLK